eukprot:GHUV01049399.1.p1 GENE.GHUV01049399.1~~GHUV01049399.1.p1  ORF type:complete len:112 (-),score=1.84 GHUV01049399.1:12-347(-)
MQHSKCLNVHHRRVSRAAINRRFVKTKTSVRHVVAGGKVYLDPVQNEATAFAPATVANLGPGFDWLGCAVEVRISGGPYIGLSSRAWRGLATCTLHKHGCFSSTSLLQEPL